MNHLPGEDFYESKELDAAEENGSVHNLESGLVGLEEFDAAKNSEGQKDEEVHPDEDYDGEHFSVIEVLQH